MIAPEHNEANGDGHEFRAFLSCSRADSLVAAKLHQRLEAYRLPRQLRPGRGLFGSSGRLGHMFHDTKGLLAESSLSEPVKRAIHFSQSLIVVCSPDAKASSKVEKEVALFRELHPDRPILAALVQGEPTEAFPKVLSELSEPLAADLRRQGDGKKLAILKLVAGLVGKPLDAIIQRDAQRRSNRVMAVTLIAVVLALVMMAMTTIAIQARDEAQQKRNQAEQLIEFMLTDLRQDLHSVGRLEVMTDVNQRALNYYTNQGELSDLPIQSLERRGRVIGKLGEDNENRGNTNLAKQQYNELHRTTAALLAKEPTDPQRILNHAYSENRIALFAHSQGKLQAALKGWRRTQTLLDSIFDWQGGGNDILRLSGYVNGNIGAALLQLKRSPIEAIHFCQKAVRMNRALIRLNPEDASALYDLVFHKIWLADALVTAGKFDQFEKVYPEYLDLVEMLIKREPENKLWQQQHVEVFVRHSELLKRTGRSSEAQGYHLVARKIVLRLAAHDPKNSVWKKYAAQLSRTSERKENYD